MDNTDSKNDTLRIQLYNIYVVERKLLIYKEIFFSPLDILQLGKITLNF